MCYIFMTKTIDDQNNNIIFIRYNKKIFIENIFLLTRF